MKDRQVGAKLTEDQFNLARHRMFVEHVGWQLLISAAVNAYILGDLSVTPEGRYSVRPPQGRRATVEVPREIGDIEVEPDWQTPDGRPDVDPGNALQNTRATGWGTRELTKHLRKVTGRSISVQYVRKMLNLLGIPKEQGNRWYFKGPHDEYVKQAEKAIEDGIYDKILEGGLKKLQEYDLREEQEAINRREAIKARRELMARKVREISED